MVTRLCKVVASIAVCLGAVSSGAACSGAARGPSGPGGQRALEPKEIFEHSKPAIVRIEAENEQGGAVGTGFVITADGRVATNLHVIGGSTDIDVVLADGTRLPVREIAAADMERDLVILAVRPSGALPTLPLGDSDRVSAGDPVVAIGNPLGVLDYTVSDGLISSVRAVSRQLTILQISAPISQGSSGGPLFNRYGEVIGVATFFSAEGQNLNFGIPSNYLRVLMAERQAQSLEEFAADFRQRIQELERSREGKAQVQRRVPTHDVSLLDGCDAEAMLEAVRSITEAIRIGAPLYNRGDHEACFRIYEGTSIRLERESACPGVRDALGQGLLRAGTEEGYTARAWAMRDAFDGLLDVITRRIEANP